MTMILPGDVLRVMRPCAARCRRAVRCEKGASGAAPGGVRRRTELRYGSDVHAEVLRDAAQAGGVTLA
ncbi:hypothetical protein, partial [Streptomyces roseolilacinus]|uniref:hypothetical protein n=1 Tax=Streptomyces roseolilacinus TaxID=66904 RepID=UPI003806497F